MLVLEFLVMQNAVKRLLLIKFILFLLFIVSPNWIDFQNELIYGSFSTWILLQNYKFHVKFAYFQYCLY